MCHCRGRGEGRGSCCHGYAGPGSDLLLQRPGMDASFLLGWGRRRMARAKVEGQIRPPSLPSCPQLQCHTINMEGTQGSSLLWASLFMWKLAMMHVCGHEGWPGAGPPNTVPGPRSNPESSEPSPSDPHDGSQSGECRR